MLKPRALWVVAAGICSIALSASAAEPLLQGDPPAPIPGEPPRVGAPPPEPFFVERRVPSTELGFAVGVGPARGETVTWQGASYLVVEVTADGGRPTFSGGSRFAITTAGGMLLIGLQAIEEKRPTTRSNAAI